MGKFGSKNPHLYFISVLLNSKHFKNEVKVPKHSVIHLYFVYTCVARMEKILCGGDEMCKRRTK